MIVPLQPHHLALIEVQPEQAQITVGQLNEKFAEAVIAAGESWACVDGETVHAAAGVVTDEGRTLAWAILGKDAGRHLTAITRKAREVLKRQSVEVFVRQGHAEGERWARMLGLRLKTASDAIGPDGRTFDLWGL